MKQRIPSFEDFVIEGAEFMSSIAIKDNVSFIPMEVHADKYKITRESMFGMVVAVRFTDAKVFYDIVDDYHGFMFDNVDSYYVKPTKKQKLELEESNVNESRITQEFYHGSTDKDIMGKNGIHVGTKKAATQALQARIGVPAVGEWDGTREYGETLLAGKKTLLLKNKELGYWCDTGFNCGPYVPEEDYYPNERKERAKYSDGSLVSFSSKPIIFKVDITGPMTNSQQKPMSDSRANSTILRQIKMGNAKSGYYYVNDGEDEGSISAVVPDKSFLKF